MPAWSVRFIRTAWIWLLAGLGLGAVLLGAKGFGWTVPWVALLPLHAEILLIGWLLQFTLGVAHWMLPKHAAGPERGAEAPVAYAFVLINGGVLGVAGGAAAGLPDAAFAGHAAEVLAVALFAFNAVPRIKPFGAGRI